MEVREILRSDKRRIEYLVNLRFPLSLAPQN